MLCECNLRILIHCKNFMSNIIKECLPINKNITVNFIKICNSLNELNYNIINAREEFEFQNSISPKNFLKVFTKTHLEFKIGQQDGIEFWRILFNVFSKQNYIKSPFNADIINKNEQYEKNKTRKELRDAFNNKFL